MQNRVKNPGSHAMTKRQWGGIVLFVLLIVPLWYLSQNTYSEQPAVIVPENIGSSLGIQAIIGAQSFNANTGALVIGVKFQGNRSLLNNRSELNNDVVIRVVDDLGTSLFSFQKGDLLSTREILIQTDGDVNQYPFDKYKTDFSMIAEIKHRNGAVSPINLTVGTSRAETGWFTTYKISSVSHSEEKITIVDMKREPFHIAFAITLATLMFLLAFQSLFVGFQCFTHRTKSDPGVISWLGALLFIMPIIRRIMPGDPPIGCALDVKIFIWAIIFCALSIFLAMFAWIKQTRTSEQD